MKITAAVVEHKGGKFHMRDDIDLCKLGAADVRVHMVASGICHTDEALRRGDDSVGYPVILGHEGAGIVEKVGAAVSNFKPGD
jgi:aryl-alcohol dehydrogenase